jgi:RHS repeat-associated protein
LGAKIDTYAYSPRGVTRTTVTTETVPQPFQYAGAYHDPTGLYHLGARSYDPNLGRFTQPDPSGQETNQYLYAGGDPVNNTDPTGLFGFSSFIEGTGHLLITGGSAFAAGLGLASCVPSAGAGCAAGFVAAGTSLVEGVNAYEDLTKAFDE